MPACRSYNESVKRFGRDRNLILLESSDVLLDRIASIHDRFLSRAALSDATREARTLGDPLTVLSSANDDLAHGSDCRISAWRCQSIHNQICVGHACGLPNPGRDSARRSRALHNGE